MNSQYHEDYLKPIIPVTMTELDALAQLTELIQKIEENNWDGIYKRIEKEDSLPFTPRTIRQEKEIKKLVDDKHALELENQNLRIKVKAVQNILNEQSQTS